MGCLETKRAPMCMFKEIVLLSAEGPASATCETLLRPIGVSGVQLAATAKQAIGLVGRADSAVDLILLDADLPDLECFEIICNLKNREVDIPLVVLSQSGQSSRVNVRSLAAVYGVHVAGEVSKPLSPSSLEAVLEELEPARASQRA